MSFFFNVYSGNPAIPALIIVNYGLYRLFNTCSNFSIEMADKDLYTLLADRCCQNLEILLARLPFNIPVTIDYVTALCSAVSRFHLIELL